MRITDENDALIPIRESRRTDGAMSALNAEVVHVVDGDESVVIYLNGTATLNATYVVEGSPDGIEYFPLLCYPYAPASLGGTLPQAGQPLITEAVNAANVKRMLCAAVGGLRKILIRLSAFTSGNAAISMTSDSCASISPYVRDQKSATLMVSATAAVGVAVTATLPAVAGLRHYIDFISVTRSATAALTASATPVLVTSSNIPNAPVMTFGSDVGGVGVDVERKLDFGASGIAAAVAGTATSIVCPAYTGVIWRVNVAYRLGL